MPIQLNMNDLNESLIDPVKAFYEAFHEVYTEPKSIQRPCSTRLLLPTQFGEGEFNVRKLDNATFSTTKLSFSNDIHLAETAQDETFFLSVSLGTEITYEVSNQRCLKRFPSQMIYLGYSPQDEIYRMAMPKNKQMFTLSFFFSKEQLSNYLIEFDRPDLINTINTVKTMELFERAALSTRHHHLISKLANNPYHGAMERLYFESISGELMINLLESLCSKKTIEISLTERDKELLLLAKQLLLKDLQHPLTITQLAKAVGLNEDKLKKGFKFLFNNTIFKTLTEYRMQQAMGHIKKHDMSISEIAYDAGYENVSKFISAFKRTYGKTPGMMRKEIKYYLHH